MIKPLHCFYNMDSNSVEITFSDGPVLMIDCDEAEIFYDVTNRQMADLDWLLYKQPWNTPVWCCLMIWRSTLMGLHSTEQKIKMGCRCIVNCDTPAVSIWLSKIGQIRIFILNDQSQGTGNSALLYCYITHQTKSLFLSAAFPSDNSVDRRSHTL